MIKTYALALEKRHSLVPLNLPLMTLPQAQAARTYLLGATGQALHVINVNAE